MNNMCSDLSRPPLLQIILFNGCCVQAYVCNGERYDVAHIRVYHSTLHSTGAALLHMRQHFRMVPHMLTCSTSSRHKTLAVDFATRRNLAYSCADARLCETWTIMPHWTHAIHAHCL